MFKTYKKLKQLGILSINQRNAEYVLRYNDRKLYPLVDDKLKTKQLALKGGIGVPALYFCIKTEHDIQELSDKLTKYNDFVIKPARGAGGDGIIVVTGQLMNRYRLVNGKLISQEELKYHFSSILSGIYSLGGHADYAIVEKRVIVDPVFSDVSFEGIPDIRIITLLGYPAMAMLRLPTRLSNGKANLHQGAIGVGIDIKTGMTLKGVFHNDIIDIHPDTLNSIENIKIPYWTSMLTFAAQCYELTNLGYLGVDIVLDREHGPMMLELNARPGLNIQIANNAGIVGRFKKIEAQGMQSTAQRVNFSRETFGSKV